MSRSRKKNAVISDYSRGPYGTKKDKREASKAVRNYKGNTSDGRWYKKIYCSYNIHDYKIFASRGDSYYKKALRK